LGDLWEYEIALLMCTTCKQQDMWEYEIGLLMYIQLASSNPILTLFKGSGKYNGIMIFVHMYIFFKIYRCARKSIKWQQDMFTFGANM